MEKFVVDSLVSLKAAIASDSRVVLLNSLEKKLAEEPALIELSKKLRVCEDDYSYIVSAFPDDKKKIAESQHRLHLAKLALDEEPLAHDYNEAFKEVSYLYMELDDVIFSPYRMKSLSERK